MALICIKHLYIEMFVQAQRICVAVSSHSALY